LVDCLSNYSMEDISNENKWYNWLEVGAS
jgi:hypothetical protein